MSDSISPVPRRHYAEIDLCRGIGILLVVMGHALKQTSTDDPTLNGIISVIYSFHMPLFFLLSGFVAVKMLYLQTMSDKLRQLRSRAVRLLIPYFFVGILYFPLKFVLSRYAVKPYDFSTAWRILLGENPNTTLWFLYALFWISAICIFLLNPKTLPFLLAASGVLSLASYYWDWSWNVPRYLFFFVLGIAIRLSYDAVRRLLLHPLFLLAMGIGFVGGNVVLLWQGWTIVTMLTALCGSALCFAISCALGETSAVSKSLIHLGAYSMDIYILSDPVQTVVRLLFWNILQWNALACIAICFVLGTLLPLVISQWIVRRVRWMKLCILGISNS